jgi:hypothetical protein
VDGLAAVEEKIIHMFEKDSVVRSSTAAGVCFLKFVRNIFVLEIKKFVRVEERFRSRCCFR